MPVISIELSDVGIRAASGSGRDAELIELDSRQTISPAYALVHKRKVIAGVGAAAEARKQPRQICSSYWENLSTQPVADGVLSQFTYADLAFAHLEMIWKQIGSSASEVIMAVPGHFDKTRLGLILGMGRELDMGIRKMVDAAVLSCLDEAGRGETIIHVDVHMHRVVITLLKGQESLGRDRVKTLNGGWAGLKNQLIKTISKKFVKDTRFDPMHSAESEQLIFNQLDDLLNTLVSRPLGVIEMKVNGQDLRVPVSVEEISAPYDPLIQDIYAAVNEEIEEVEHTRVVLTDRAARIPGLYQRLQGSLKCPVAPMPEAAAAYAGILHAGFFTGSETGSSVGFMTSLPLEANPNPETATDGSTASSLSPTHVLAQAKAYRLDHEGLLIGWDGQHELVGDMPEACRAGSLHVTPEGCRVEALNGRSLLLNGVPLTGPGQVVPGDRIRIDDTEAEFIAIITV